MIKNGITKNYCDRTVPCLKYAGNHFNLLTLIDNLLKLIKTNVKIAWNKIHKHTHKTGEMGIRFLDLCQFQDCDTLIYQ